LPRVCDPAVGQDLLELLLLLLLPLSADDARSQVDFVRWILALEKPRSHIGFVRIRSSLPVLLILSAVSVRSEATMLADWSLDEVLHRADLVVIGEVVSQSYVKVADAERGYQLMTESHIRIEETMLEQRKSDASGSQAAKPGRAQHERGQEIVLSQLGGVEGKVVSEIVGDARLHVGQQVLLVTYQHKDGRRYLVGMSLGFYEIAGGELLQNIEATIFDRQGRVLPAPGQRAISMEAMRAAIARERSVRERGQP
jgi:hypothetical protein